MRWTRYTKTRLGREGVVALWDGGQIGQLRELIDIAVDDFRVPAFAEVHLEHQGNDVWRIYLEWPARVESAS